MIEINDVFMEMNTLFVDSLVGEKKKGDNLNVVSNGIVEIIVNYDVNYLAYGKQLKVELVD